MKKFTDKTIDYEMQPIYKALKAFFDSYFLERDYVKMLSFMADDFEGIGAIEDKVIENKTGDLNAYEEKIKKLIDIENPTRELLQTIVDKIIIDKDKNVEIIYKFSIMD